MEKKTQSFTPRGTNVTNVEDGTNDINGVKGEPIDSVKREMSRVCTPRSPSIGAAQRAAASITTVERTMRVHAPKVEPILNMEA